MNRSDFDDGMAELAEYYGDNAFNPRSMGILWRIVGDLTRAEFARVIEDLVQNHPRTPSIASVKKAALPFLRAAELRRQSERLEQLEQSGKTCLVCGHSGFVSALLRSDPRCEFSFRCPSCPAAKVRRISISIREYGDDLKAQYIPVSLRRESYEAADLLRGQMFAKMAPKKKAATLNAEYADLSELGPAALLEALRKGEVGDARPF